MLSLQKYKAGACANASPFSGEFLGDFRMSKLLDKSYSIQVLSKASMWEHIFGHSIFYEKYFNM